MLRRPQSSEHEVGHRRIDPSLGCLRQRLVVLAQPTTPAQPCECALNHPSARQYFKSVAAPRPFDDPERPACQLPHPLDQLSSIPRVSPDQAHTIKAVFQLADQQLRSISVLNVGRMNHHVQQQSCGVHYDVVLSTFDLFARVVAARPPFSVVLTDWLSMMAALGSASLPSASRTSGRNSSWTRFHVPSTVHPRKYLYTVCQGGRSFGSIRQEHPLRRTYRMPFTISRRSTERGRPPLLAGGSRGARISHCSSVRSLG